MLTGAEARTAMEAKGLPYEEGVDSLAIHIENADPTLREVLVDDFAVTLGSQRLLGDASKGPAPLELADLMLYLGRATEPLLWTSPTTASGWAPSRTVYLP